MDRFGSYFFSGKSRHFAFILGIGFGYVQYKIFSDMMRERQMKICQANNDMIDILNNVKSL